MAFPLGLGGGSGRLLGLPSFSLGQACLLKELFVPSLALRLHGVGVRMRVRVRVRVRVSLHCVRESSRELGGRGTEPCEGVNLLEGVRQAVLGVRIRVRVRVRVQTG